jgi:hypothetical protein
MDLNNYRFRYEAYKNNTFDLDIVEKSLEESKMSGYQYLRQFQLDSTGYRRFDFTMQEIYRTNNVNHIISYMPRRWLFFIEHEFINVGKRLAYKRSEWYEKDLSFTNIVERPDLFDSTFLVFVDGKLYTDGVRILCKEDKTYVIFICKEKPSPDGFSISEMRRYIEEDVPVTIYFIPNTGIKSISTNAYRVRTQNNNNGIPLRTLGLTDYVNYDSSLTFIKLFNEISSIPTTSSIIDNGLYINNDTINEVIHRSPDNTSIDIQIIPLRNLLSKIEVPRGANWFEIPMQDYPVAVENCLIMDEHGMFIHNAKIEHHYPNVYHITNVDDIIAQTQLFVYVFYFENKVDKLKHLDMLAAYHKYVPDYLERYQNGTVSDIVKNFNPQIVDYSIKDYRKGLMLDEFNDVVYIKNSDDIIYEIKIVDNDIITSEYTGEEEIDAPKEYYVLDKNTMRKYKIGMGKDKLYSDILVDDEDIETDIIYIYDKVTESHNNIGIEKGVLALFEYMYYSDHFKYKILKMREFIKADVNNFRRYLRNLGLGNNYYYVDVSKIDLSQRKRIDNRDTKLRPESFDTEMYMFVFRNDFRGMFDEIIIHIDGTRYEREIQVFKTNMLDYIYIPCELIKPDTILEVEKVSDVLKDIHFRSDGKSNIIRLDISEVAFRNKTLFNDLFIVDKATGEYLDPSTYQIILPVKFHVDDIESDIVLDYIITETDRGYYQMSALDHGLIEVYQDDELEDVDNAFFVSFQSDKNEFYEFDINNNVPKFNKVDYVNGYVINKIRSMDKKMVYQFKMVDGSIKLEISEDDGTGKTLAEGGLNLLDLSDVFLQCPREIKIRIIDKEYLNKDLVLHIKKHHNILFVPNGNINGECLADVAKVDITRLVDYDSLNMQPIPFKTACKKDSRYFRIYQNGRLIPRHLGVVTFPNYNIIGDAEIYPGFYRELGQNYNIAVECMPYMMKQVCYLENIPRDKVIDLRGLIDKPFDFKWYDIYINGRKLVRKEVEIISANMIRILKTDSLHGLEIIENSRDKEYFGGFENGLYDILDDIYDNDETYRDNLNGAIANDPNVRDIENVLKDIHPLDFVIRAYYDYLISTLGLINPDYLQITRGDINKYSLLLNENTPFGLGFDAYGTNREEDKIVLPINPDE